MDFTTKIDKNVQFLLMGPIPDLNQAQPAVGNSFCPSLATMNLT